MRRDRGAGRFPHRVTIGGVLVLAVAIAAALGTASTGSSASGAKAAAAACGALPRVAPTDPQGALKTTTSTVKSYYNGWPFPLKKSQLANWKPKGNGPYTVGILFDGLSNPFQAYVFNSLQKFLNRSRAIDKVIAVVSEAGNPTKEVQNYQSLVQQGADLIIVQPSSAPAMLPVVRDALKQGVATLAYINPLSDASAVSIGPNVYTSGGQSFANLLKLKGGRGNFLAVHGIRVTAVDKSTFAIYDSLLKACPNVKIVGEIDGNFAPPAVRAAVLQFLATYPGDIDAVYQTATMGPSIIGAFQQAGRTVPSVQAAAAQKGDLAYWSDNASKGYQTVGFAGGPTAITNLMVRVTLRMLAGQGPKVSDIPWPQPQITNANYKQYVKPGWTVTTPGTVEQPRSTHYSEREMNSLFTHPERKAKGF